MAFGKPEYGWLPVTFSYGDFSLSFDASDVLNNPIEELYLATGNLHDYAPSVATWWLEPAAYLFTFERNEDTVVLKIIEKADLNEMAPKEKLLFTVEGNVRQILAPFRAALDQFSGTTHDPQHWPYADDNIR